MREAYVLRRKSSLIQMDLKGSLSPRRQNEIALIKTIGIEKGAHETFLRFFISGIDRYLFTNIVAHIFIQYLSVQIVSIYFAQSQRIRNTLNIEAQ